MIRYLFISSVVLAFFFSVRGFCATELSKYKETELASVNAMPEEYKNKKISVKTNFLALTTAFHPYIEKSGYKQDKYFQLFFKSISIPVLAKKRGDLKDLIPTLKRGQPVILYGEIDKFRYTPTHKKGRYRVYLYLFELDHIEVVKEEKKPVSADSLQDIEFKKDDYTEEVTIPELKATPEAKQKKKLAFDTRYLDFETTFPAYMDKSGFKAGKHYWVKVEPDNLPVLGLKKGILNKVLPTLRKGSRLRLYGEVKKFTNPPKGEDVQLPHFYFELHYVEILQKRGKGRQQENEKPDAKRPPRRKAGKPDKAR